MGAALLPVLVTACEQPCPRGTISNHDWCIGLVTDAGANGRSTSTAGDASDASNASAYPNGRSASSGGCVSEYLYVDSVRGKDDNDGSELFPFKTFARAMRVAVSGQTVNLEGGTYSALVGDDLTVPVPDGITLQTRPTSGVAVLDGQGTATMTFVGSASVQHVSWVHFATAVRASQGTQRLREVSLQDMSEGLLLSGTAHLECEFFSMTGDGKTKPTIMARGSASVELHSGELSQRVGDDCLPAISIAESASLSVDSLTIRGGHISAETSGSLRLRALVIDGCSYSLFFNQPDWRHPTTIIELESSTFEKSLFISHPLALKARRSYFAGAGIGVDLIASGLSASFDFGAPPDAAGPGEPGANVFLAPEQVCGLRLGGSNNTALAHGNVWTPNAQGANQFGQYPTETEFVAGPGQRVEGQNITVVEDGAGAESRVRL